MLKQDALGVTLVGPLTSGEEDLPAEEESEERPYHSDEDLSELALLRYEIGEARREIREARDKLDESLRLAKSRDRAPAAGQARRRRTTRGALLARAILRLMVAVFTLGGAIAGVGVALTVVHVWGDSVFAAVVAAVFGLAVALGGWLLAALGSIVLETADAVRSLPA